VVYVLHVFQKKARRGIATPRQEIDLVRSRYKLAQDHYRTIERHEEDRHA
jgi:phage-related protein